MLFLGHGNEEALDSPDGTTTPTTTNPAAATTTKNSWNIASDRRQDE
jgi:hypothetical protein